jgi:DNA modification methylase
MRHKARGIECEHPAVFPVDLASEMLNAYSDHGDVAFEPFCGSGTQIVASEKEGRWCFAIEIAPGYVDIAVKRWSKFTGRPAYRGDVGIRVGPCIFRVRDQPIDRHRSTLSAGHGL